MSAVFYEISSYLFVSDYATAEEQLLSGKDNITAFLSIGCELKPKKGHVVPDHVRTLAFPAPKDTPEENILATLLGAAAFVAESIKAGRNTIVHCVYGQSRSVSVALLYHMVYKRMSLAEALRTVKAAHPRTCVNPGFLATLHLIDTLLLPPDITTGGIDDRIRFIPEYVHLLRSARSPVSIPGVLSHLSLIMQLSEVPSDLATVMSSRAMATCLGCSAHLGWYIAVRDATDVVASNLDDFWSGYVALHSGDVSSSSLRHAERKGASKDHKKKSRKPNADKGKGEKSKGNKTWERENGESSGDVRGRSGKRNRGRSAEDVSSPIELFECDILDVGPMQGAAIVPLSVRWHALSEAGGGRCPLTCEACHDIVGWFERDALKLCHGYVAAPLYAVTM